jgi:hypothetical protein
MRRLLALTLAAAGLAGCGGGHGDRVARAAPPSNRCVAAATGDLADPGPFRVRRRAVRLSRRLISRASHRIDPVAWLPVRRHACRAPLVVVTHGRNGSPAACERLAVTSRARGSW